MRVRRRGGTLLTADLVVIRQGPKLDSVGSRAGGQLFRSEGAVGDDGVGMQVGVGNRHRLILGWRGGVHRRVS